MNHSLETPLILFYSDAAAVNGRDMANILRLCTATDKLLGRRTLVSDLTIENYPLFQQAIHSEGMSSESKRRATAALRTAWKAAIAVGLTRIDDPALKRFVDGFQSPSTTIEPKIPDGQTSLSELCEKSFPLRTAIRSEDTKYQYRIALRDYARFLGRPATLEDLNDDAAAGWLSSMLDSGLSVNTARERFSRLLSLWRWLAKRGEVRKWPTVERPAGSEPLPKALTEDQLRGLFRSADMERGQVAGIPGRIWWKSYLAFIWNTSERKSAALAVEINWLDLDQGTVSIPPKARKGGRKWGVYELWPETIPLLRDVIAAGGQRKLVWPWDKCQSSYYTSFNRILRGAGIPVGRKTKTHGLRCSHATHLEVAGGDSTQQLGHGDKRTTQRHYLDPILTRKPQPKIFVPWTNAG